MKSESTKRHKLFHFVVQVTGIDKYDEYDVIRGI